MTDNPKTLRDEFAMAALTGCMANPRIIEGDMGMIAQDAAK